VDVEKCPNCSEVWLDCQELDELEDTVFDIDEWKGTLVFKPEPTRGRCLSGEPGEPEWCGDRQMGAVEGRTLGG
jgi:hypothetical protein